MKINKYIDHTLLKPEATKDKITALCEEAKAYDFASVCVNPYWVSYCKNQLIGSDVKVATVIGFPLGANTTTIKAYECEKAIQDGADEIDMVINVGALKDKDYESVLNDIVGVVKAANGHCVKVILETCLLSDDEIRKACELCKEANANFVKTSTGFSSGGATIEAVAIMKEVVQDDLKIKASGGIRGADDAKAMIEAGATRIGTSAGTKIVDEWKD